MKKIFGLFFLLFVALFFIGCTNEETKKPVSINYNTTEVEIKVGESFKFEITDDVSYINGNSNLLNFDKDTTTITGVKAGETFVTIYLNNDSTVKLKVIVKVLPEDVIMYVINYNLDGGKCNSLIESFKKDEQVILPTPEKANYNFLGWYENDVLVNEVTNKNYDLVAKWERISYTITYNLDGGTCENLIEQFTNAAEVTLPTPVKENHIFLGWFIDDTEIKTIENKNYELTAKWEKHILPTSIEITKSCDDAIIYSDTNLVLSCVVLPEGASQEVTWKAQNKTKATIDETGLVTVLKSDEVSFLVVSDVDGSVCASITLIVRSYINPYNFIQSIQIENVVAQKITAYPDNTGYSTYLLGGVCNLLFEPLKITPNMVAEGAKNRPGTTENGNTFKARYVTVHDVGAASNALANSNYCRTGGVVSWHYTVGNDGLFQQLPLNEIGWHAGDGTGDPLVFYDSGITAPNGSLDPARVTINPVTGKFVINSTDTLVTAPVNSENNAIVMNSQLPYTGINNYVDPTTGHYMIGKTYWNETYNTLANRGGNLNSIGIETTINKGSNIYYTWELTAKLISTVILPQCGLKPTDVKQHNTFSGKNCPQTMRTANMWERFMELVKAEYVVNRQLSSFKFEFVSHSEYIGANGMITKLPATAQSASYSIRMTNTTDNIDYTFDFTVMLPANSVIAI